MARTKVEKVESSIKGGVVAQLGQKTLILGRNGRGKSAIVNAIELAGTGAASDIAGRALVAKDAELFMLAPPGASKVWAEVRFDAGLDRKATWELEKGHRAKRTGTEIAFPLRGVREALLGSPETARKWILEMGGDFEWDEVLDLVPKSLHKRVEAAQAGPHPSNRDALITALETAKKSVREANAQARAARSLSAPPQPPPTDAEITAVSKVIETWRSVPAVAEAGAAFEAIKAARATAASNVERLTTEAQRIEAELTALPAPSALIELHRSAVAIVEANARANSPTCGVCGSEVDPVIWAPRAKRGRERIEAAVAIEKRREDLNFALRSILPDLGGARRELERLTTEEAREEKRARSNPAPVERPAMSLADAHAKLRALQTTRAGWDASKRGEEQALEAEREAAEWGQVVEALSKAIGVLVEKAKTAFCARVQRFLPRSDLFGIDLLDGEREVLRVGLLRLAGDSMVLHAGLSGAEWARVTAALALATSPKEEEGPCVVCPEERAFDPFTLSEVLAAFDAALGGEKIDAAAPQIIITSPVSPVSIPPGWEVIRLGDEEEVEKPPVEEKGPKKKAKKEKEPEPAPFVLPPGASIFD